MNAISAVGRVEPTDRIRRQTRPSPPANAVNYRIVYDLKNKPNHLYYSPNETTAPRDAARYHRLNDLDDPRQVAKHSIKCIERISDGRRIWPTRSH
jgi:hypothetical protein